MDDTKERQEAIFAGEQALLSLREARRHLSGAKGFGLWDIFGGGTLVSLAKHFKINKAQNALSSARYDLQNFSRELADMNINIDIGAFLTFFDIYDNFLADIIVQSRLSEAVRNIDDVIHRVESILSNLKN